MTTFIKLIRIYQLFILQFTVVMADQVEGRNNDFVSKIKQYPVAVWEAYKNLLKVICKGIEQWENCDKNEVAIPVAVSVFVLFFCIICLICCKCCCKKSCCKKKENDESDVDYNQFIMGPDGQMYSQMYQVQMMQPQMIPAGMMYPQMYPQMYYQQMYQGTGMQGQEMQGQGIQGQEMQNSDM